MTITFNGVSSDTFNALVFRKESDVGPSRVYDPYAIDGRSGDLLMDRKRYPNVPARYTVIILGANAEKNFTDMKNCLLSQVGYQRIEDSDHPDEFYMAYVSEPIEPVVSKGRDIFKFELVFSRKPQRYLKSGETSYSFIANAEDIPVEGNNLYLYGYSVLSSVLKAKWPVTQMGNGNPSPSNVRPILAPLFPLTIGVDGIVVYSESPLVSLTDAAAVTADLRAGSYSVTHKLMTLEPRNWTMTSAGVFQLSGQGSEGGGICSHYKPYSVSSPDMTVDTADGYIVIRDSTKSTLIEFTNWLQSETVQVAFPLATPTTGSIPTGPTLPSTRWFDIFSPWTLELALSPDPVMLNPSVFPSQPLIRIFGAGTFTLNDITVTVSQADEYTDVDCELMDCYKGNANKNQYVSFSTYDFPVLKSGQNTVEFAGGVTAVTIIPRWWRV